jgi:hypothetical protein
MCLTRHTVTPSRHKYISVPGLLPDRFRGTDCGFSVSKLLPGKVEPVHGFVTIYSLATPVVRQVPKFQEMAARGPAQPGPVTFAIPIDAPILVIEFPLGRSASHREMAKLLPGRPNFVIVPAL